MRLIITILAISFAIIILNTPQTTSLRVTNQPKVVDLDKPIETSGTLSPEGTSTMKLEPSKSTTTSLDKKINASSTKSITTKSTSTTTVSQRKSSAPVIKTTPPAPVVVIEKPIINTPTIPTSELNKIVRGALVNILCNSSNPNVFGGSGSGVVINDNGVIITNAHVAIPLLFKNYKVSCIARTGAPARGDTELSLLYISPNWIGEYKNIFNDFEPRGTGEFDFAILKMESAPSINTAIKTDFETLNRPRGELFLTAGYTAEKSTAVSITNELYASSGFATSTALYTFKSGALDMLGLSGNVTAMHGASGGAVTSFDGRLVGIITATSDEESAVDRETRAVLLSYINRQYQEETGKEIEALIEDKNNEGTSLFEESWGNKLRAMISPAQ